MYMYLVATFVCSHDTFTTFVRTPLLLLSFLSTVKSEQQALTQNLVDDFQTMFYFLLDLDQEHALKSSIKFYSSKYSLY